MKHKLNMKRKTVKLILLLALGTFFVSGCQTGNGGREGAGAAAETVVSEAPPLPRVEVTGIPPGGPSVWVSGYWKHHEDLWIWVPGRWQLPPFPGAVWRAGHWDKSERGWTWTPGRWD
jgi:predicted small secreted protein